ncbi:MAG: hypothetical protein NVV82_22660 [Sporocytophaga sp.]|nr:hypothetical protein [Sporocytophaga sp.]
MQTEKKLLECEHFLNDNGSINYSYEIWSYDDNVRYDTVFYKYNNDDQVILEVRRSGNSIDSTSYVYSDGNLVSSSVKPENRKSIYTVSEHENKYNIFEDRILIPGFYGKGSRNLIVKEVDTIPNYGVMTSTYNYEYNSDGLITSRDFLEMDSNNPDEPYWEVNSTIGYSCK